MTFSDRKQVTAQNNKLSVGKNNGTNNNINDNNDCDCYVTSHVC